MTGISAVVATYNRKDELKNLFDSLNQDDTSFLELIIVDQNEDGLIDDLIRHYSSVLDIKHLKFKERQNSKASSAAAAASILPAESGGPCTGISTTNNGGAT